MKRLPASAAPAAEPARPGSAAPVYVPSFDAYRGFAVMAIVVVHLMFRSQWVPESDIARSLFISGFLGVDVFFLISGFVMFLPVAARGTLGDVRAFFIRRFARIAPAFYVAMFVTLALLPLLLPDTSDPRLPPHDVLSVIAHLLFVHNEVSIAYDAYYPGFGVNPAFWTLSIEIIFYALLPLVAVRYLRRPFVGVAIAAVFTLVWRLALDPPHDYVQNALNPSDLHQVWKQFPLFAVDFAAGMTLALVYVRTLRGEWLGWLRRHATPVAAVSSVVLLFTLIATGSTLSGSREHLVIAGAAFMEPAPVAIVFPLLFAAFALAVSFTPARLQWPLTNRAARKLGDLAYGVYLYHLVLIAFAATTLDFPTDGTFGAFAAYAAFTIPLSLVLAWLSLVLVERPTRGWARRLARRIQRRDNLDSAGDSASTAGAAKSIISGSSGTR